MFYIYLIINCISNTTYVGLTKNFLDRKRSHLHLLRKNKHFNKHLQASFNKYGESNFYFWCIQAWYTLEKCKEEETAWINYLTDLKIPLFNKSSGGEHPIMSEETRERIRQTRLGTTRTDETKKRISENRTGKCAGTENSFYGKTHTDEALEKMKPTMFKKGFEPWNKGKSGVYNEEKLAVMSSIMKRKWEDPEFREKLSGKDRGGVKIEAFGESKTLLQWERDPRCKVRRGVLSYRMERNWNPEVAITTPPKEKDIND